MWTENKVGQNPYNIGHYSTAMFQFTMAVSCKVNKAGTLNDARKPFRR